MEKKVIYEINTDYFISYTIIRFVHENLCFLYNYAYTAFFQYST